MKFRRAYPKRFFWLFAFWSCFGCRCGGRSADKVGYLEGNDHREFDVSAKDAFLEPWCLVYHLLNAKFFNCVNVFLVCLKEFTKLFKKRIKYILMYINKFEYSF